MGVGGRTGATFEASHAEMPAFTQDAAVDSRKDYTAEDPTRVLSYAQAKPLDGSWVLNRGAFPAGATVALGRQG